MDLTVGIVGLPNSGKSTLFNALLKRQIAEVAEYPFTTIEPNTGVVEVPDERPEAISKATGIAKIVPAPISREMVINGKGSAVFLEKRSRFCPEEHFYLLIEKSFSSLKSEFIGFFEEVNKNMV